MLHRSLFSPNNWTHCSSIQNLSCLSAFWTQKMRTRLNSTKVQPPHKNIITSKNLKPPKYPETPPKNLKKLPKNLRVVAPASFGVGMNFLFEARPETLRRRCFQVHLAAGNCQKSQRHGKNIWCF